MKVLSWIIALFGLWEFGDIALPFMIAFGHVQAFVWNQIIVGMILVLAGAWTALTSNIHTAKTMDWIAAVTGVWLMIAPFILGPRHCRWAMERYHRWHDRIHPRRLGCSCRAAGSWLEGVMNF